MDCTPQVFPDGMVNIFVQHTSCSLVLMENADPSARKDLEFFMDALVPENYLDSLILMKEQMICLHIKMALTRSSENIPFSQKNLQLGTWQGIFLWEHRVHTHNRKLIFSYFGQ